MSGLDRFISVLEKVQDALEKKPRKKLDELGKFGVEFAKAHVQNVDTGATRDSIKYKVEGNCLTIEAGGNAVWLEFGTGIAYNHDGYPGELPDGISPVGTYGEGHGSDPNGWYYPTDNVKYALKDDEGNPRTLPDGRYLAHTYGIQSNHFMWDTMNAIEEKALKMGLKLVDTELKAL